MLVGDPVVAKQIVEDEPQKWVKEGTAFFPGSSLAGNGLLVSDGDTWRRQRRLSNPAFRTSSVSATCTSCGTPGLQSCLRFSRLQPVTVASAADTSAHDLPQPCNQHILPTCGTCQQSGRQDGLIPQHDASPPPLYISLNQLKRMPWHRVNL